ISRVLSDCPKGQLKHGDKCCKPVLHCPSGSYVKTCELNDNCDECLPCPPETENPFITSSSDVKKCYKNDCLTGFFRTSEVECQCAFHAGYIVTEDKKSCQKIDHGCQPGLELNFRGRCETCADDHYKYWIGHGYCIKHFDCFKIQHSIIPGNHIIPATCLDFNDTCSPNERFPPLPPGLKPTASPIPFIETTTTTPSIPEKRMTTVPSIETTEKNPTPGITEMTTKNFSECPQDCSKKNKQLLYFIGVLIIIIAIQAAYMVRRTCKYNLQYFPISN
ncbi:uncharacterized protein LOC106875873, partial [Octopus bimaculoides]|uniref:uncharacterized protein LOC106875873 n=1 Tax=Octopus bimaculoides TaxID=37653 RepID=UPI00071E22E4